MRAGGGLAFTEGRLGLGIKAQQGCAFQLRLNPAAVLKSLNQVYFFGRQALKQRQGLNVFFGRQNMMKAGVIHCR